MAYKIFIKPSACKDLDSYPDSEVMKISSKLMHLQEEPRPIGIQKLTDKEGYRIRIGNYRVLYQINDASRHIYIYRIKHRKDVYK